MAEGQGFEPWVNCSTIVFETIRFGRSRTPPECSILVGALGAQSGQRLLAKNDETISLASIPRTPLISGGLCGKRGSAKKL